MGRALRGRGDGHGVGRKLAGADGPPAFCSAGAPAAAPQLGNQVLSPLSTVCRNSESSALVVERRRRASGKAIGSENCRRVQCSPVALVSAVSSTTTLFVFLFGVLLTAFFPALGREDLSARNLLQKGCGAVLIAGGVALANLHGA